MNINEEVEGKTFTRSRASFYYGGVFVLSCAIILFEICLLRIFSVLFLHHYAFAIVSVALLGLGLGGIVVHMLEKGQIFRMSPFRSFSYLSNFFSLLLLIFIVILTFLPVLDLTVYTVFLLTPFIVGGMVISRAFEQFPDRVNRIYFFNLLGSSAGAVGVLYAINFFGGINVIVFISVLASLSGLMFATASASVKKMIIPTVFFFVFLINLLICIAKPYLPDIPIDLNAHKEIYMLKKERDASITILETRWSAFGRTDLIEFDDNPYDKNIFIDGTAGSPMYRFDGNLKKLSRKQLVGLKYFSVVAFPYYFLKKGEKDNILIIGPGGGRDVLITLMHRVGKITAVDVNPDMVSLVKDFACYNGGIYTDFDNVNVIAEEGRSFLRGTDEKFDLIVLPLAVTKTSRSLEGYTLTESYLYTNESIQDYFSHLTDEGRLVFLLHDRIEVYRLISIILSVFEKRGINLKQAMNHLYVTGTEKRPLLVVKKKPFKEKDMFMRHVMAHKLGFYKEDEKEKFNFFPFLGTGHCEVTEDIIRGPISRNMDFERFKNCDRMDKGLNVLYRGRISLEKWLKHMRFDTKPVTDNRPFFHNFSGKLPKELVKLLRISGIMVIFAVFAPPILAFVARKAFRPDRGENRIRQSLLKRIMTSEKYVLSRNWRYILTFLLLGTGFMLIEITLIQRFILFLGQPVLSLSILLLSLFIGMGFGALFAKIFMKSNRKAEIMTAIIALIILVGSYAFLLPVVFNIYLGYTLLIKMLISVGLITPLGFLLGIPFPSALNLLKQNDRESIIPWMWGVNGVSSVLGSMLAVAIAIIFGFDKVILMGILMYACILLVW
ncbi:MAG: hypothetical protein ACE5JK_02310 [Candidatus Omnitrophota bacterium]